MMEAAVAVASWRSVGALTHAETETVCCVKAGREAAVLLLMLLLLLHAAT